MNVLSLFDGMSCGQIALNRVGIKYDNYFASEINKDAIFITQKNYPNTIQLGDVTKINGNELPKIDLLIGGSPCFTAGNLVMTIDGYKPIEDIVVGDLVLTHKNRYCKVLKIGNEEKETIKIKSQGSTQITTTFEHPFYCSTQNKKWNTKNKNYDNLYSDFYWKEINKFNDNDKVVSLKWGIEEDIKDFSDIDLYILGRFLADGCCFKIKRKNRKNSYSYIFKISIGKHEMEDFKNKVDDRFTYIESRTVYNAYIYQQKWVEIGEKFGHLAHNKFIPNFILNLPKNRLKIFINGYMDGDGCIIKNKSKYNIYKRNTTVSEKLALTLSLAIQKCYYGVHINFTERPKEYIIEKRVVNQRSTYSVYYTEEKSNYSKYKNIDDYILYNITKNKNTLSKIVKTNKIEKVFNIEVENDNSYIVNNLIVHNCQGFSFAGKQLNFEDERSKLFFEFIRLKDELKPKYFLLENVVMKKEYENVITNYLGVEPILINSNLVSAQNRKRLYWTNIPNITLPKDKGITLQSILSDGITDKEKGYCLTLHTGTIRDYFKKSETNIVYQPNENGKYEVKNGKISMTFPKGKNPNEIFTFNSRVPDGKYDFRKLTVSEMEKLQTVPDGYTQCVSYGHSMKALGNGWTIDVIAHIFSNI